jgi:hypothetical protein
VQLVLSKTNRISDTKCNIFSVLTHDAYIVLKYTPNQVQGLALSPSWRLSAKLGVGHGGRKEQHETSSISLVDCFVHTYIPSWLCVHG